MKRILEGIQVTVIVSVFVVLVGCVSWQVITRYALGVPSTVTDEIARFLFIWLALIGGAYTYGQGRHLAIDVIPMMMTGRARLIIEACITLLVASFALFVMIWGGYQLVSRTLDAGQISPSLQIPMGLVYLAIPFAGVVILAYAVVALIELARGRLPMQLINDAPPVE
ncbi:2,3-diketo-L-gulonate TRAP transporter small permease protein YiaM [Aquimixticola soesokkakensis]|uniref:TRAP transporter small permease protein n=1 Tax=Aquimixticola soesokkakensis TaxID=1519096 RepID=A0A1Y5RUY7_9RHOB|nr:TRAP transporter small permease [Aquimixticola soesokkakensis]SLN23159.1 2,3-diketo-L-gulonate TRAP transporter small permease protein YiaM [Aquimixticola soesokkakensis]